MILNSKTNTQILCYDFIFVSHISKITRNVVKSFFKRILRPENPLPAHDVFT
jgi:hypothetical protein